MRHDRPYRVVVANYLGPLIADRVLRIVFIVISGPLAHNRLTVLQQASEDTNWELAQLGCVFLPQLHQSESVVVVLAASTVVCAGSIVISCGDFALLKPITHLIIIIIN